MIPRNKRSDDARAFLPDPDGGPARTRDDLAENLAEEFLKSATSAEDSAEERDDVVPEELGGPFLDSPASQEFDRNSDPSNPEDAEREPFPQAIGEPRR